MEILDFILEDNYEYFLRSISSNSFDNLIQLINDQFEIRYNGEYKNVKGKPLEVIMKRMRNYVFKEKENCLKTYVGVEQSKYMRDTPCILCALNHPCERCEAITPFDIFRIDKAKNRFLYSCRRTTLGSNGAKHICLHCYAKVGNPEYRQLTRRRVIAARERHYINKVK